MLPMESHGLEQPDSGLQARQPRSNTTKAQQATPKHVVGSMTEGSDLTERNSET